jgi:hypothetical protein
MTTVKVFEAAGDFAENKDVARKLRTEQLMPALDSGQKVIVDFEGVSLSTQSFIHALISDALRKHGASVLDNIQFRKCNRAVQALIATVCDYMQDSTHAEEVKNSAKGAKRVKA